jgi:predicted transcriptional regulator of viral defense system
MKYIELRQKIKTPIFSLQDLKVAGFKVRSRQLSEWADNNYLIKLKNGVYLFADKKEAVLKEHVAFNICQPSYVSLEWALSIYGLIPETVYNVTSITVRATREYNNDLGGFIYRHVKKELFFGYNKITKNSQTFLLAEPEKALLDYLYLNAHKIKTEDDIEELRLNEFNLKKLNKSKIKKYSGAFPVKSGVKNILKLIF